MFKHFSKENSGVKYGKLLCRSICISYISISGFTVQGKLTYGGNKLSIGFDTITISPPPTTPCWGLVLMCYNHLSIFSRTLYWPCVHPERPSPQLSLTPTTNENRRGKYKCNLLPWMCSYIETPVATKNTFLNRIFCLSLVNSACLLLFFLFHVGTSPKESGCAPDQMTVSQPTQQARGVAPLSSLPTPLQSIL
jgi:hypothetical protein